MKLKDKEKAELLEAYERLSASQRARMLRTILAFGVPNSFERLPTSDVVNDAVLNSLGDRLIEHHCGSRQALSKDRFEFAFEASLNEGGIPAQLVKSRTNRGHDISIRDVPTNLKTEAAAGIRDDVIHVSKWMELGKGEWDIDFQRRQFLEHLANYERIFTLRRLNRGTELETYELVEIPKALMLESANFPIELAERTRQATTPGYVRVLDTDGSLKYALYFDAGSERKLQIKGLRKDLCTVHATWVFGEGMKG